MKTRNKLKNEWVLQIARKFNRLAFFLKFVIIFKLMDPFSQQAFFQIFKVMFIKKIVAIRSNLVLKMS